MVEGLHSLWGNLSFYAILAEIPKEFRLKGVTRLKRFKG